MTAINEVFHHPDAILDLKLFGGDTVLATSLLARINALENADTIKDINPELHPGDEKPRLSLSFLALNP